MQQARYIILEYKKQGQNEELQQCAKTTWGHFGRSPVPSSVTWFDLPKKREVMSSALLKEHEPECHVACHYLQPRKQVTLV